jgi:uncharacterized protein
MIHYLVKLIPPRPTFAQDMSEREKKLMQEHAAYWKELLEKNIALVYGPVMDPKGYWGAGIIEVENENEAKMYMANDPTVKANLNGIELLPMKVFLKQK